MASKRHQRKKACEWKRSYIDRDDAIGASIGLRRRTGSRTTAYRCPFCGRWHHGHLTQRTRRIIEERRG